MMGGCPSLSTSNATNSQSVACLLEELSTQDLVGSGTDTFLTEHFGFR